MLSVILAAALVCPKVYVYNISKEEWKPVDTENQSIASRRCGEKYPDDPCLVRFVKVEPLIYRAICGPKQRE